MQTIEAKIPQESSDEFRTVNGGDQKLSQLFFFSSFRETEGGSLEEWLMTNADILEENEW
ncbi:hypothetical protein MKW98_004626, partial [Papaver atlanticum]